MSESVLAVEAFCILKGNVTFTTFYLLHLSMFDTVWIAGECLSISELVENATITDCILTHGYRTRTSQHN